MVAKPEYSSPPDEVCCWQGRRGGAFAGQGAVAQLLAGALRQSCWQGVPWRRGWRHCGREPSGRRCQQGRCSEEPSGSKQGKSPCCRQGKSPRGRQGKSHPVLQANKKESGKTHSLKPALVMTALVRVTGARPRGSSQLLLCSLELLW